jgi:hypothetical protein
LVFLGVGCSPESRQPPGLANADIVACGNKIDIARFRKFDEPPQFDALIAPDTRIRRCAFEIAGKKVVDDAGTKGLPGIDYLMRNIQCLGDISGNADLAASTFLPSLGSRDRFVFVLPDLKGDAMDVIALANQQRCGDRAVHSAAHAKENCRASHRVAIVLRRQEKG